MLLWVILLLRVKVSAQEKVAISFHGYVGDGEEGLREVNIFDRVYIT